MHGGHAAKSILRPLLIPHWTAAICVWETSSARSCRVSCCGAPTLSKLISDLQHWKVQTLNGQSSTVQIAGRRGWKGWILRPLMM
jgi:hypothetical protein